MESAKRQILATATVDPGSISANATLDVAVAVPGVAVGNIVTVEPPSTLEANVVVGGAWASDVDEVTVRLGNLTASPIDPASASWGFAISY